MTAKSFIRKLIPPFFLNFYHFLLALAGAVLYGFPGNDGKIKIIGVTGTSGKSTTVDFITRILEEAGFKVASFSSIRFKIGEKEWKNQLKMTMPGRLKVQKFLRQSLDANCQYAVLEITSEGIRQHRHRFIDFRTAVFTNLTPEHIESHGGFENYRNEKLKLFRACKNIHIINIDDQNSKYFFDIPSEEKWLYGFQNPKSKSAGCRTNPNQIQNLKIENIIVENIENNTIGFNFDVCGVKFDLNLFGDFNIYNALAGICVGLSEGISLDVCQKALKKAKSMPGRMEIVSESPLVIIDYAHTPEQLEKVYKTLSETGKQKSQDSRLIAVFGSCGGGRDKWKRPVLGKIAGKYCDEIFITNEDPYDENPFQILSEIKAGISDFPQDNLHTILDRKEAIKKAVKNAGQNDVVAITGKGSEPWMCIENGKKIPWDDKEIAKEFLSEK